jgi:flagellar protein FliS
MSFSQRHGIRAYSEAGAAGAMGQSPHGLISMLFEGATIAVSSARTSMQLGLIQQKCEAVSKAIAIIEDGLIASLDPEAGGELAERLARLYEYMVLRLVEANTNNDSAPLEEVASLLTELAAAWAGIGNTTDIRSTEKA